MVEVLLDSGIIGLIINFEFVRKQRFKLKKIKVRNINRTFNKKRVNRKFSKSKYFL